jgi:SRSO17 transposase
MSGASIEQTLDLWAAELGAVKAQIQPLFNHASVAASAGAFLDGVLGPERRKTGWMRAEAAGDPGPWRQQAVLGRSHWDAEALRDLVRDYALETLAAPDAMLVIDETGFLKQGSSSCGVQRQYTGSAGKITNCQIGVFAAYVSAKGHAFIDRRLYLPKSWTGQPDRRCAAHVPDDIHFATKPAIAVAMIERALNAGVAFLGCRRQHLRRGRGRKGLAPGWQGLCAWGHRHAPILVLGQGAGGRHGGRDRPALAGTSLGRSLGRRRHQGSAAL